MAYRLLLAYAFVLPGSSKIAHTGIRNIGPTTISLRNNDQLLPLHDRVVIEQNDAVEDIPQQGKVIAIGPGGPRRDRQAHPVRAGDRILFGKWSGTEVKIDGVEYLMMKESDIMRVLVEVEAKKKAA